MEFNSWSFVFFFPVVCLLYWTIREQRCRNAFLLVASYFFYMCWNASYGILLFTSTLISYLAGIALARTEHTGWRKLLVTVGVVLNLALIAYFKYADFGVSTVNWFMQLLDINMHVPLPGILLPVGVSFFVFQSVGYTIDVYRRTVPAECAPVNYALFISFFPQLVAGPIERSGNMLPQFREKRVWDDDKAISGLKLMLWGYFMKLVLADRCALYVGSVFDTPSAPGYSSLLGIVLFPFQIYGDFAGYTYIAIGVARIMGFHLNDNFNHPYFACTVGDFWRRWHISLSTWFRDYLYFPLGGSRCKKWRIYFNLMATFLASGLWHGAMWTYVAWGGVHGLCLCIERALGWGKKQFGRIEKCAHVALTFLIVALARLIYRAGSLEMAWIHIKRALLPSRFTLGNSETQFSLLMIFIVVAIVIAKDAIEEWRPQAPTWASRISPWWRDVTIVTALVLAISLMASPQGGTFVYFQF
ncbi:MAG: MBOAT family protein [Muribaculaceae bacterium]|nr:MBOAT family protein [Muribaculaceae bacterium]